MSKSKKVYLSDEPGWLFAKEVVIKEEHVDECQRDIESNPDCSCYFDDCTLVMTDCSEHDARSINPNYVDAEAA